MNRNDRELTAVLRRRNGVILRWLPFIMLPALAVILAVNFFTAAGKHGAQNERAFLIVSLIELVPPIALLFFRYAMPRFLRQRATPIILYICAQAITMQGIMLHLSAAHPLTVAMAQFIGFGVLVQLRFRRAVVFLLSLYVIPVGLAHSGAVPLSVFIPATLPGPIIGIMAVYLQNLIMNQSLTIRRKNRALIRSNRQSEAALTEVRRLKGEQDLILETVGEGLFLIDEELKIASQFSAALPGILDETRPAGLYFPDLVRRDAGDETARAAERFLKLLFKPHVAPAALADLNPLHECEFETPAGVRKVFQFRFSRIVREERIAGVLAAVRDVTGHRQLEAEIAERETAEEHRMLLVFRLVQMDADLLRAFLDEERTALGRVHDLLAGGEGDMNERLPEIFRLIHSLKGNAAVLDLRVFETPAHEFEEEILRFKPARASESIAAMQGQLQILRERAAEIDEVITRLHWLGRTVSGGSAAGELISRTVETLTERLSRDLDVSIELRTDDFDRAAVPSEAGHLLRDVLVQLVRNSIMHGLESPADRAAAGKPETGTITIATKMSAEGLTLVMRDDGRGLDLDRIRERALADGRHTPDELSALDDDGITELIFQPGLTTTDEVSLHAGRGIGLDLVRSRVEESGGRIDVRSEWGVGCEFRIRVGNTRLAGNTPA